MLKPIASLAIAALVVVGLAACTDRRGDEAGPATEDPLSSAHGTAEFEDASGEAAGDHVIFDSPDELAAAADLVVRGRLRAATEGRTIRDTPDDPFAGRPAGTRVYMPYAGGLLYETADGVRDAILGDRHQIGVISTSWAEPRTLQNFAARLRSGDETG